MKCDQEDCTKRAKLKVSLSYGQSFHLCYKHSWRLIKSQLTRIGQTEAGMYIQRVPLPAQPREIDPAVRRFVTTPEDRMMNQSGTSDNHGVRPEPVKDGWEW